MAYKYFTEKLIGNNVDLGQIFPEKQAEARASNNVTYSLADIVMFLKDRTSDFKFDDKDYIDLDNAISEIVSRYYKSIGEKNPFVDDVNEDILNKFNEGVVPREPVLIDTDKGIVKGKGTAKAPKSTTTATAPIVSTRTPEDQALMEQMLEAIKSQLIFEDSLDDASKEALADMMNPEFTGVTEDELKEVRKQAAIEKEELIKQGIL